MLRSLMQIKSGKEDAVNYVRWIRNSALGVEIKWGMLFSRGVTKHFLSSHFDNFPFLWEWGGWGSRRPCSRLTVSVTCLLFKAVRCFQPEKKKREPSTFLISSKLGCLSLCSCYDNSFSPPSSFGSISKWRTMDAKDQKMGKASRH